MVMDIDFRKNSIVFEIGFQKDETRALEVAIELSNDWKIINLKTYFQKNQNYDMKYDQS